jgi:hypothetical protein
MAYIPRSSLIPNESSGAIPTQMKKRRTIHVFGLISTFIFILSLLAAVGVFFYNNYLEKELTKAKEELGSVSSEDNRTKISEIRRHYEKQDAAKNLIENHIAPSKLFEEIENSTKKTVQFSSLEFSYDPGFEATLTLSGSTKDFSSVALQKMELIESNIFSDFVLQDITTAQNTEKKEGEEVNPTESVVFSVTGVFKKDLLTYETTSSDQKNEEKEEVVPEETDLPKAEEIKPEATTVTP